jgi:hypothetical protein
MGILADDMYDSNNNFRYLSKNHIKPGIKTRSNSKIKSVADESYGLGNQNFCSETRMSADHIQMFLVENIVSFDCFAYSR